MGISLSVFLIIYFVIAAIAFFIGLFNLYHIFRFGHYDAQSYFMTGIFITGMILIVFISGIYIIDIDWNSTIKLFSSGNSQPSSIPGSQF